VRGIDRCSDIRSLSLRSWMNYLRWLAFDRPEVRAGYIQAR
jgi:hypothetical protein